MKKRGLRFLIGFLIIAIGCFIFTRSLSVFGDSINHWLLAIEIIFIGAGVCIIAYPDGKKIKDNDNVNVDKN